MRTIRMDIRLILLTNTHQGTAWTHDVESFTSPMFTVIGIERIIVDTFSLSFCRSITDMSDETIASKRPKINGCQVCDDQAFYTYFGAVVCEACKMFSSRHSEQTEVKKCFRSEKKPSLLIFEKIAKCKFSEQCVINVSTRHVCGACRLKKCLQSGMQVEKIRHSAIQRKTLKRTNPVTTNSSLAMVSENSVIRSVCSELQI